ncbi:MAG: alpha/beta hydrolase family protein [Gammaproteobacteria bacterium]
MYLQHRPGAPRATASQASSHRSLRARAAYAAAALAASFLCASTAHAQVAIFQENFASGTGAFTASGTVSTSTGAARLQGCYGCTDGALTSTPINATGFSNLTLSFDRVTSSLDTGEGGIAEWSLDGVNWTVLETTRVTTVGRVSFNLPANAAGQPGLRLRFRINASLSSEWYSVDNVQLTGVPGDTTTPPPDGGTNPYARGPAPTVSLLEATTGPFTTGRATVARTAASGYGGGTIYFPTNVAGPFGAIAVSPGYTAYQSSISWWGSRLASHGFVVITIDTLTTSDQPAQRATELMAALRQLVTFSNTSGHPIRGLVDPNRLGVMGHSMGGGGTLIAARDNPTLKAAIPLAPWNTSTNFTAVKVPTLVVACEADTVASVASHASPFYNNIPSTTKKAYIEFANASHICPVTGNSYSRLMGKYGVAWMKRFMDNDTRYSPFLCGAQHQADLSNSQLSEYRENCPY